VTARPDATLSDLDHAVASIEAPLRSAYAEAVRADADASIVHRRAREVEVAARLAFALAVAPDGPDRAVPALLSSIASAATFALWVTSDESGAPAPDGRSARTDLGVALQSFAEVRRRLGEGLPAQASSPR
jgi:hypothetical protein